MKGFWGVFIPVSICTGIGTALVFASAITDAYTTRGQWVMLCSILAFVYLFLLTVRTITLRRNKRAVGSGRLITLIRG